MEQTVLHNMMNVSKSFNKIKGFSNNSKLVIRGVMSELAENL